MKYNYKKWIKLFIQGFSSLILGSVFLMFVKCVPYPNVQLLESVREPECDIYTERCLRSGSGFDVQGSGGDFRREELQLVPLEDILDTNREELENDPISFIRNLTRDLLVSSSIEQITEEDLTDDVIDQVSEILADSEREAEEALDEICDDYEDLFSKIDNRLSVDKEAECIEFDLEDGERHRTLYCPVFEYVNGCLRVKEVDDPMTSGDESDNFNIVCLNEDYEAGSLSEPHREELRDDLEKFERREAFSSAWKTEKEELSDSALAAWYIIEGAGGSIVPPGSYDRNNRRNTSTRGVTLQGDGNCDGSNIGDTPTKGHLIRDYPSFEIDEIYDARNRAYTHLDSLYDNTGESRLRRNIRDVRDFIDEMYRKEVALAQHETELIICERKQELYRDNVLVDLNADLDRARVSLAADRESLTTKERERDALEEEDSSTLDTEISTLETNIETLEGDITVLEEEIGDAQSEANEITRSIIPRINDSISDAEDVLEEGEDDIRDKVIEILSYLHDRLSDGDRKAMVDRLLERQEREFRRIMARCIYEEDSDCLEPLRLYGTQGLTEIVLFPPGDSGIPRTLEARNFIIRQFIDKVATQKECERGVRAQSECGSDFEALEDDEDRVTVEDEVDTIMKLFSASFQSIFNEYFEQPYGLACGS